MIWLVRLSISVLVAAGLKGKAEDSVWAELSSENRMAVMKRKEEKLLMFRSFILAVFKKYLII
jgi:hypothetical protein